MLQQSGKTTGIFAIFLKGRGVVAKQVVINFYAEDAIGRKDQITTWSDFLKPGFGTTAIATLVRKEVEDQGSARAQAQRSLLPLMKSEKLDDMEQATLKLVQLSAQWRPDWVGGSIDQVLLDSAGVHWLRGKPCSH